MKLFGNNTLRLVGIVSLFVLTSSILYPTPGQARPLTEIGMLAEGPPENLGKTLGSRSYVVLEARKLAHAKVLWINWDYLKELGFEFDHRTVTPEIEKAILDAFAWGVPTGDEPDSAFTHEKRLLYPDRYGGDFLGGNMGSGRAASLGEVQNKGVGVTELATTLMSDHKDGLVGLSEAIREAIYGEVGNVLPKGANRVIAVIDRGTTKTLPDGKKQVNTLVIRQDPLRPAHYLKNVYGRGPLMESEEARTQEALSYFLKAFPVPAEFQGATEPEQVRTAVLAYGDRMAEVYAASRVRKIYHGATSLSNIEASGRYLDYGTMTTVPDYGKLKIISGNDAVGDIREFKQVLMKDFVDDLHRNMPPHLSAALPSADELAAHFAARYEFHTRRELLALLGISGKAISRIENLPSSVKLTRLLERIATQGSRDILDPQKRTLLTDFNLNRTLVHLASVDTLKPGLLEKAIEDDLPGPENRALRKELVLSYRQVLRGVNPDEKVNRLALAQDRNAERPEVYRWELWRKSHGVAQDYVKSGDPTTVSVEIDRVLREYGQAGVTDAECGRRFMRLTRSLKPH